MKYLKFSLVLILICNLNLNAHEQHKGRFKKKLSPYDVFFGSEDVYQVCYPKSHRVYFNIIILLSISVVSFLSFLIITKNKNTKLLLIKNKVIEDQNKELLDSIIYAQRIQNALLPEKRVQESANANVFFKPKDIVSGDFYWFFQRDEYKFYAVIDCTGHGVPGAFLSFLAHTALNYAVEKNTSNLPNEILDLMNDYVKLALKQQNNQSLQDGMEVGICVLNTSTNQLFYAGANINLIYIQNSTLNVVKAAKCTVGSVQTYITQKPEVHIIQLQKGDRMYMHSDGIVDQFGYVTNKKLTSKKLKEILQNSTSLNFEKQFKHIEESIIFWKGEKEQTDDMLFMCVEV